LTINVDDKSSILAPVKETILKWNQPRICYQQNELIPSLQYDSL